MEAVKTALQQYFYFKAGGGGYARGNPLLPDKWKESIYNDGNYVNS